MSANPEAVRFFSLAEKALYQQAIAVVSRQLIEAAPQAEGFALSTAATALQRLEEIGKHLKAQREQAIQAADEYAIRYLDIVRDEPERMEVFGLPRMDRLTSRQSLSMAYITLSASGSSNACEQDESLLTLMAEERSGKISERRTRRIDEIACDCRRLVIRGGAGAGKSTLLQWMAVRAASQSFTDKLQP